MNTRINSYAKVKDENSELKRKLKEIKELVFLVLLSNPNQENKENERDTFLKIYAIVTDDDK